MQLFKGILLGTVFTCIVFLSSLSWAGDFNNDGIGDLVWNAGAFDSVALWLMDNNVPGRVLQACTIGVVDPKMWDLGAIDDMNGDNKDDLVWVKRTMKS